MSRSKKPATTQSVLEAFVFVRSDKNKAIRLFYEWLAQHDAEVAKATEERIIKLLEDFCDSYHSALDGCGCPFPIALIRGEK